MRWTEENLQQDIEEMVQFASDRPVHKGQPVQGNNAWGCTAGRGRFSIDPKGEIFACARMIHAFEKIKQRVYSHQTTESV